MDDRNHLPRITGTSVIDDKYLMRVHELAHGAATTGLEVNDALLGMATYIASRRASSPQGIAQKDVDGSIYIGTFVSHSKPV